MSSKITNTGRVRKVFKKKRGPITNNKKKKEERKNFLEEKANRKGWRNIPKNEIVVTTPISRRETKIQAATKAVFG